MKYEIIYTEGLWMVFKKDRPIAAFETKKEALEAVKRYMEGSKR